VIFDPCCRDQLAPHEAGKAAFDFDRWTLLPAGLRRSGEADEEDQGHHQTSPETPSRTSLII
jgi:hypothetical protein